MPAQQRTLLRASRAGGEDGFSLIELLVVAVIIGILAAIAIPSFLAQTHKATDAAAKVLVRAAQTATAAYSTDRGGSYAALSVAQLQAIEPTLKDKSSAELLVAEALEEGHGYLLEAKSVGTGDTFGIELSSNGAVVRTCGPEKRGGCPAGGRW